jgi:phage tail-like protein
MTDTALHPSTGFSFVLSISGSTDTMAFQEATGISAQIDTEAITEGGENSFKHRLPTPPKYTNLVLKRGLSPTNTPLCNWVQRTITGDLSNPISTHNLLLQLTDADGKVVMTWKFVNAWPIKLNTSDLNTQQGTILIESVEFAYTYMAIQP